MFDNEYKTEVEHLKDELNENWFIPFSRKLHVDYINWYRTHDGAIKRVAYLGHGKHGEMFGMKRFCVIDTKELKDIYFPDVLNWWGYHVGNGTLYTKNGTRITNMIKVVHDVSKRYQYSLISPIEFNERGANFLKWNPNGDLIGFDTNIETNITIANSDDYKIEKFVLRG